jgi:hypothetical protein
MDGLSTQEPQAKEFVRVRFAISPPHRDVPVSAEEPLFKSCLQRDRLDKAIKNCLGTFTTFTTITHCCPFACSPLSVVMAAPLNHCSALSETRNALVSRISGSYITIHLYYISYIIAHVDSIRCWCLRWCPMRSTAWTVAISKFK